MPFPEVRDRARARLAGLAQSLAAAGDGETRALAEILFEAYAAGLVELHTFMPALALEPGERPTASPLARLQASREARPLVSTLLHTPVLVEDPLGRYALQLLDGTRDRMALLADLRRWVREQGRAMTAPEAGPVVEVSPARLEERLHGLAHLGLLVA